GDFGADVIKIEAPGQPDPARDWGEATVDGGGLLWPIIARNKRCMTLNLRVADGQALLKRMLNNADVLIENFRPGTLEKWGLGPDTLMDQNPRLVIVRVSGYGQTGPESSKAGYASVGEAKAGLRALMGEPDRPPARAGVSLGDTMTGTFAALGAMMALYHRERSGRGQVVDAAIYESVLSFMESLIPEFEIAGHVRTRTGSILPRVAPSGAYRCTDGDVVIGANQDSVFARLAKMCGAGWALDPNFATHDARGDNQIELDKKIEAWTSQRSKADVLALAEEFGVPCGPVNSAADLLRDAQIAARDAIVRVADPKLGAVPMQAVAPKLSRTPGRIASTGPAFGAHTDKILSELGLDQTEIDGLRRAGVI
ncbi:MAG: CoA transferase, partial [Pseudomonadota bacterium]